MTSFFAFAIPVWAGAVPYTAFVWPALVVWVIGQVSVWRGAGVHPRDYIRQTPKRRR
jgi:hypothetical protein